MDARLTVLKLVLNELQVPDAIDTIDDRKRVQKAIYLGQRAGVDLGYRFAWYLKGPYSTDLTRDYYALAEAIKDGEKDYEGKQLVEAASTRLQSIRPLMSPPNDVALEQEDWLELLASADYLHRVRYLPEETVKATLAREKSRLAPYYPSARQALQSSRLL